MRNIRSVLGCPETQGDIGIEIELEADNLPPSEAVGPIWRKEADASLRGESGEFVLDRPLPYAGLDKAFRKLDKAFRDHGTRVRPTYRAGIHVHINVQDLTPVQLVTFISSYFMLEEVLLRFCDSSRLGNHFCLRMSDASFSLDAIVDFIMREDIALLNNEDLRYASLNLTSLFRYGSIEFRALESTLDYDKIKVWAGVLYRLKEFAQFIASPVDLLGQVSLNGFAESVPIILGDFYPHFRPYATEDNVKTGVRQIQYAVYARDWSSQSLNIFKKTKLF